MAKYGKPEIKSTDQVAQLISVNLIKAATDAEIKATWMGSLA